MWMSSSFVRERERARSRARPRRASRPRSSSSRSASAMMPRAASIRAWARDRATSCGHSRRSKPSDVFMARKAGCCGSAKRLATARVDSTVAAAAEAQSSGETHSPARRDLRPAPRSSPGRTAARSSARRRPRRPGTRPRDGRSARGRSSSGGWRAGRAWTARRARAGATIMPSRSRPRGSCTTKTNQPRRSPPASSHGQPEPLDPRQRLAVRRGRPRARRRASRPAARAARCPSAHAMSRQAVVEAEPVVVEPVHVRRAALVALGVDALLDRRVAGRDASRPRRSSAACWRRSRRPPGARARRPRVPSACTAPSASQASSTIGRPQRARTPACRPGSRRCGPAAARVVRSVTAAAAASGSRFSVTRVDVGEHRPRALVERSTLARATNENGDVTTSSPSRTPAARSARCSPAVPLDTALACATPSRAAKRRSNSGSRGPSESWPGAQDLEHALLLRGAEDAACASGISARAAGRGTAGGRAASPHSSESTSASHEAAITFSVTPIEPQTSWPSEASSSTRVTAPVPFVSSRMRTLKLTSSMSREVRVDLGRARRAARGRAR